MKKVRQNLVVAEWWHYDSISSTIYGEYKLKSDQLKTFHFQTLIVSADVDAAWLAIDKSTRQKFLLWNDRELVPEQEIVAEVWPWCLRSGNLTYAIYACLLGGCRWEWSQEIPRVFLCGKYRDGGYFEDNLRLIIPLENDSAIAISNRNRRYYLHGPAIDREAVLSPKKKHKSRRKKSIS